MATQIDIVVFKCRKKVSDLAKKFRLPLKLVVEISNFLKSKMADGRNLEKSENGHKNDLHSFVAWAF